MSENKLKFIDLFSGIGGFHLGFEEAGAKCVFASDNDKFCRETYEANFDVEPVGDIKEVSTDEIPDFDILTAGFPCQPFSLAGVTSKEALGRKHGFEEEDKGNLFFEITRILEEKKPDAYVLENVKHLKNHDEGKTFNVITEALDELGYYVNHKIIDAQHYVPQHRERIFIVGFRKDKYPDNEFNYPETPDKDVALKHILEDGELGEKYTRSDKLWNYLQDYKEKHRKKGNGFGYTLMDPEEDDITRTLSARYHKDGSEILIKQDGNKNPRMLTPRECARLMGFSDDFEIPVSDTQAYQQFGNAVVVPLVEDLAENVIKHIKDYKNDSRQADSGREEQKHVEHKREGHRARAKS